ncbi:MAG: methionyl-tRNA formyltransferase [Methylococcaceae bacterium]|nr:methionyl-tRNA formyltransferase [Methylococcaceae bacterium]
MKIIFAGTPAFAVPSLQALIDSEHHVCAVYTQPDRPAGRGRHLTPSPVKVLALQAGIPVYQPETLKTPEALAELCTLGADLMVVVAFGMILPQTVLDVPKMGCINIHASLLPRWRGAAPIQRAIMAGDAETGVTIMQIVLKLDAGDMLHKETLKIADTDTASEVHDQLAVLGAKGLPVVLAQIQAGALQPEPQAEALVTYAEKLYKQEATVDWTQPALLLSRQIRGLYGWPVAQTLWQGQVLRIWRAHEVTDEVTAVPGMVRREAHALKVATGAGWLSLDEVQLPGGKRLAIQDFMNAHALGNVRLG